MTWKDILKIDMDEARRLGDKYAPEDMEEDGRDKDKRINKSKKKLRALIKIMKLDETNNPKAELRYANALQFHLREMPNPPRLRGKNLDQMISIVEDFIEDDPKGSD